MSRWMALLALFAVALVGGTTEVWEGGPSWTVHETVPPAESEPPAEYVEEALVPGPARGPHGTGARPPGDVGGKGEGATSDEPPTRPPRV